MALESFQELAISSGGCLAPQLLECSEAKATANGSSDALALSEALSRQAPQGNSDLHGSASPSPQG